MKKIFLFSFFFCFTFSQLHSQTFNVDTIFYGGDETNRINLVIMGDGYKASEIGQFHTDAASVASYFFNTPPFDAYKNFFNFFAIDVISVESGTDHPGTGSDEVAGSQPITTVDSYLETSFDNGVHRCVFSNQTGLINTIANTNVPSWDFINVIINTTYYGGCAGGIAFTTMHSSAADVFAHEFGHMFGNVSDEYDYGNTVCDPGNYQGINVTQETDTSILVWKNWLTNSPIPTPAGTNCGQIGLYEGAQYCSQNWYRPKCDCKMRALFEPYCEVCYEQLIYRINEEVSYIDNYSPTASTQTVCGGNNPVFDVDVVNTTDSTVRIQWFVNNVLAQAGGEQFTLSTAMLSPGSYQVKVVTSDTTEHVRKNMQSYSHTWTVNVSSWSAGIQHTGPTNLCFGEQAILTALPLSASFQWLINGNVMSGETSANYTASTSGDYSVISTENGCIDTSQVVSIVVDIPVNANITTSGDTICAGTSALLQANNCVCTYQWMQDNQNISATGTSFQANQTGFYQVSVAHLNGCTDVSDSVYIYVDDLNLSLPGPDPLILCDGASAELEVVSNPAFTYKWTKDNVEITGANTNSLWVTSGGIYSVIADDNRCTDTSNVITVIAHTSVPATIASLPDTVCINTPSLPLTGTPAGGVFTGAGVGNDKFDPSLAGAGLHEITYTYSDGSCLTIISDSILVDICLSVSENENDLVFVLAPNPAHDHSSIVLSGKIGSDIRCRITDMLGKTILEKNLNPVSGNTTDLALDNFPAGIYNVQLNPGNGSSLQRKLIVF